MSDLEKDWLETLIKRFERERSVQKVLSMQGVNPTGKNENFLSDIQRLSLEVVLGNGARTTRSFIVKTLPKSSENNKQFVKENKAFQKEIKMYERILTGMSHLMEKSHDPEEPPWCEMVCYEPYRTIIFEDLGERGYKVTNPKISLLDRSTTLTVLDALARYQALTVAAERDGVFEPDEYRSYLFVSDKYVRRHTSFLIKTVSESIRAYWGPKWQDAALRIDRLSKTPERFLALKGQKTKLNVLNHGDFWLSNVMIKRDRSGDPISAKIIDFQLCHYDSFSWDLNHILYSSVEPTVRRDHFDEFLLVYLNSLNAYLKLYGVEMISPLTIEDVQQELNRLRLFGFFLQFFIIAPVTCELDNVLDIEKWHAPEGQELSGLNPEVYGCEKFRKLVETDVENFLADGTI